MPACHAGGRGFESRPWPQLLKLQADIRYTHTHYISKSTLYSNKHTMKRIQKYLFASLFLFVVFSCKKEETKDNSDGGPMDDPDSNDPVVEYPVVVQENNFIDITTLEQLNAIRNDLNGDGKVDKGANATTYGEAFGAPSCPTGCKGYELTEDLDFTGSKWASRQGWMPIGEFANAFEATFEGNSHTISNLHINRSSHLDAALFAAVGRDGKISNLGVEEGKVKGQHAGGLVGSNRGTIIACYTTVKVTAEGGSSSAGGLVQENSSSGVIVASYATGNVNGTGRVGGLCGSNLGVIAACYATGNAASVRGPSTSSGGLAGANSGRIFASYATGNASTTGAAKNSTGGLVGDNSRGEIRACYATGNAGKAEWNGGLAGRNDDSKITACYATGTITKGISKTTGNPTGFTGGLVGTTVGSTVIKNSYFDYETSGRMSTEEYAKSTSELQSPSDYSGIYSNWNVDVDAHLISRGVEDGTAEGDSEEDSPWDFGTSTQYPSLKVDFDKDGSSTAAEFGNQN